MTAPTAMKAAACTAARAALWLLAFWTFVWSCFLLMEYWTMDPQYYAMTELFTKHGVYIAYKNQEPGATTPKTFLIDEYNAWMMLLLFLPALVCGLATYAFWAVPRGKTRLEDAGRRFKDKVVRVLTWPLPGQRMWQAWCGGLNLAEFGFFFFLLGVVFCWLRYGLDGGYKYYNDVQAVVDIDDMRPWLNLERWGLTWGLVCLPLFGLLFWPCAHNSWLNMALGLPWSHVIKYHRWVGHFTMLAVTVHGICYYVLWAFQPGVNFWTEFSSWKDSIPFFPGTLAWFFGVPLWITSLYYCRRRIFEVFYKVHIVGFLGIMVFTAIHYSSFAVFVIPGLLPWMVDLAFRNSQAANVTTVVRSGLSADDSIATLELAIDERVHVCPAAEFFLNFPTVSLFQWHPFSVARHTGNTIAFHMKNYGNFTKQVTRQLAAGVVMPVRVTGPVGRTTDRTLDHPVLLIFAGGVGVAPVLSIIRRLAARREQGAGEPATGLPQHVRLVWTVRHKSEFTILDQAVLAAAGPGDGWLSIDLHYTGLHLQDAVSTRPAKMIAPKDIGSDCTPSSASDSGASTEETTDVKAGTVGATTGVLNFPWASPFGLSHARPVQAKSHGLLHAAAALVLSNIGAFFAYVLAYAYYAEPATLGQFGDDTGSDHMYWKLGVLILLAAMVGGIGLPAFIIHPVSIWSYIAARRAARLPGSGGRADTALAPTVVTRNASTLVGAKVGIEETGLLLDITAGRPDVPRILADTLARASALGPRTSIGVFVGGPQIMINSVQLEVARAARGRASDGPRMHVHVDTWQM